MAATKLAVQTQPSASYTSEDALAQGPVIVAQNSDNSTDTSFTGIVTLTPSVATSSFYVPTELIATTHTVQAGTTASAIIVSPALSFPDELPASYDGMRYRLVVTATSNANVGTSASIDIDGNTGTTQLDITPALWTGYASGTVPAGTSILQPGDTIQVHSGVSFPTLGARAVAGVATFSSVRLQGYQTTTLAASSSGLTGVSTNAITNANAANYDGPAELPRSTVTTAAPTIDGVTVTVGPSGADYTDIQAAIDALVTANSNLNDAIVLQAGATFTGNYLLKKKASGTGWIVIKGHVDPCAEGTRVQPSDINGNNIAKVLAQLTSHAFYTATGAHHYRLQGFECSVSQSSSFSGGLMNFTDTTAENAGTGLEADFPHHIVVDRMYVHGDPTIECKYGVKLAGPNQGVVDSYVSDFHGTSNFTDTQAVIAFVGGPFRVHNNYLEAGSENFLLGGADPYVSGAMPQDVTFTKNYLKKPLSWMSIPAISNGVKNLFEIKSVRRILIEGNVMENNWAAAQSGGGFLVTPVNQSNHAPWGGVRDATARYNVLRNSSSGIQMIEANGTYMPNPLQRLAFHDNVFWNINDPAEVQADKRVMFFGDVIRDVWLRHNTLLGSVNTTDTKALVFNEPTKPSRRCKYDDNLTTAESYSVLASGEVSPVSITDCLLNGGGSFSHNALVHYDSGTAGPSAGYPATTMFPADNNAVGFATVGITSTWDTAAIDDVLAALTISLAGTPDLRTAASDGTQVGADMTAVRSAVTGVVEGTPGTPTQTATQLLLSTQPAGAVSGVALTTQPSGTVADSGGSTVTSDTSTVTAAWVSESGDATLSGTTTAVAVAGAWAFSTLALTWTVASTGHFTFTDGALTSVDSSTLSLSVAAVPERTYPSLLVTDTPSITRAQWRRRLAQWRQLAEIDS